MRPDTAVNDHYRGAAGRRYFEHYQANLDHLGFGPWAFAAWKKRRQLFVIGCVPGMGDAAVRSTLAPQRRPTPRPRVSLLSIAGEKRSSGPWLLSRR